VPNCVGGKLLLATPTPWHLSWFFPPAQFLHRLANFGGCAFAPPAAKFCWLKNFAGGGILPVVAIPCHTLAPFHFLDLIYYINHHVQAYQTLG
jgi:hypothetical protein